MNSQHLALSAGIVNVLVWFHSCGLGMNSQHLAQFADSVCVESDFLEPGQSVLLSYQISTSEKKPLFPSIWLFERSVL